jgi:dephospho-CoA kinase
VYLIGLTGNIATGKSTVGALLVERGAFLVDADLVYRALIEPGQPGWQAVVDLFGPSIVAPDGRIARAALGAIVFADPAALRRLELATHPLVLAQVDDILRERNPAVAVHEAIKLIESGSADRCDELWVVTAPRDVQIARLVASRGLTAEQAAQRIDAQPDPAAKVARADVVIVNDGDLAHLESQVEAAWRRVGASLAEHPGAQGR